MDYDVLRTLLIAEAERIADLVVRKNKNYGDSNISLCGLPGIVVRLTDKVCRLKTMILEKHEDAVGESIDDTVDDVVGYGLIACLYRKGLWGADSLPAEIHKDGDIIDLNKTTRGDTP